MPHCKQILNGILVFYRLRCRNRVAEQFIVKYRCVWPSAQKVLQMANEIKANAIKNHYWALHTKSPFSKAFDSHRPQRSHLHVCTGSFVVSVGCGICTTFGAFKTVRLGKWSNESLRSFSLIPIIAVDLINLRLYNGANVGAHWAEAFFGANLHGRDHVQCLNQLVNRITGIAHNKWVGREQITCIAPSIHLTFATMQ